MPALPTGTVTFLFTDIEGSTRLLQTLGDRYPAVLAAHDDLLRTVFRAAGGVEVSTAGDSFFVVFPVAAHAVAAAVAAQRAIAAHAWPEGAGVRVRIGLHTGEAVRSADTYVGLDVHRAARVCAAGHGGQILLSEATAALAAHDLPEDLSLVDLGPHRLKDLQRPERLFQATHPALPSAFPPLRSMDVAPNNLPVQITSFVGRDAEMAEVKHLLASARLLTLRGPGGAGKTRLALQAAADLLDRFPDGVWLVDLAPLREPELVAQTVAGALGVREPGRPPQDVLTEVLRERTALLVLDNCEHLLAACAALCTVLLQVAPGLRILATSREPLGVAGERLFTVPPLPVPDPRAADADGVARSAAARLFVERASLYRPGFALTAENARAIGEIARRLDGIPLAIELAAARTRVLSVQEIATRLEDRFRLLTGGPRSSLPHHQTLEAAIEWSYDLLAEDERRLFRHLSVFAGGFTLETAEGVCRATGAAPPDILDLLARLIDKSLVMVEPGEGRQTRYRMLETLRQFAMPRLVASGEADAARRAHRAFFLQLAEEAELRLQGPEQKLWLDRLEAEHDNFRTALEWSRTDPDVETGVRLAGALWWFWEVRGYWTEGWRWMNELLPRAHAASAAARVKLLNAAAGLALRLDDFERVEALASEALALSRDVNDRRTEASCLVILGIHACRTENYGKAEVLGGEGLTLATQLGDNVATAWARATLGFVARSKGEAEKAQALLEESLRQLTALGHTWAIAIVSINLGQLARDRGDLPGAVAFFEEALVRLRQIGDRSYIAYGELNLGIAVSAMGDHRRAMELYQDCLALRRDLGEKRGIVTCLAALGCAAASLGTYDRAAALFGAFETQREAIGAPVPALFRAEYERQRQRTRAALGEAAFERALARGQAMSMDEAIVYALEGTAVAAAATEGGRA
ncbi:MAG: tetratricopeptide repeat protein [Armatimonadota bacterium]|nr:tetratricopeptide repeat protein [Armatimonadota bacterium]